MIPLRDSQRSYSTPYVTIALIAVNLMVFFYELSLDSFSRNHLIMSYGLVPGRLHVSTIFSSMFMHGGWLHVLGNMWFLWIFGDNVEDILGHSKYLLFYLICGIAAGAIHVVFNLESRVPTVGASGAIAGVMGAYVVKFPKARILTLIPIFVFFTTIEIPAVLMLLYWFAIQFFSGIGSIGYSQLSQGGVAWFAHIGGFLAGVILISVMHTRSRYGRRYETRW